MRGTPRYRRFPLLILCAPLIACSTHSAENLSAPTNASFQNPQRVTIKGYDGEAMEPFLTRDGRYLFFNNLNEPNVNTNLYWAERVDDLHFKYLGELGGINSPALEAVASLDPSGNFYFVSNRSYDQTDSTLYRGRFSNGSVSNIELIPGVSLSKPGIVNFDAEISANGNTLYLVESQFDARGQPKSARILIARRNGDSFTRDPSSESIFKSINTGGLNYAPATTASELELFFTRVDLQSPGSGPAIYIATRPARTEPFGPPSQLNAITGSAEAPTLSPDGRSLYYHQKLEGHFSIFRVTRP